MSVNRFAETLASLFNGVSGRGRIQRLCAELEWLVDEEDGDKITLYFKSKIAQKRNLFIRGGDEALVRFYAFSYLILPVNEVPEQFPAFVLKRNAELRIGKWEAMVDNEDDLILSLEYWALGDGLTADALQLIASSLMSEADEFDAKMRKAGLLRL